MRKEMPFWKKLLIGLPLGILGALLWVGLTQATSCFFGAQGGTGICSSPTSTIGQVLTVSSSAPFTYSLSPVGNLIPSSTTFTSITTTNLYVSSLTNLGGALTFTTASGTSITSTNALFTNASTTNFYASTLSNFGGSLIFSSASGTALTSTVAIINTSSVTYLNATNNTSTNIWVPSFATTTNGYCVQADANGLFFNGICPTASAIQFFFYSTTSSIPTDKLMTQPEQQIAEQYVTTTNVTNNQVLMSWVSASNTPYVNFIPAGQHLVHIHGYQSNGTKTAQLFAQIYVRDAAGNEMLLGTTSNGAILSGAEGDYTLSTNLAASSTAVTSRFLVKVLVSVSGVGSAPDVVIGFANSTGAGYRFPSQGASVITFVPFNGAGASLDMGLFGVSSTYATATTFIGTTSTLQYLNATNVTTTNETIGLTGYLYGNGLSSPITAATTIPASSITGLTVPPGVVATSTANYFAYYLNATTVTGTSLMTFSNGAIAFTTNTTFTSSTVTYLNATNVTTSLLADTGLTAGYCKIGSGGVFSSVATIPNTDITGLGTMSTQNANAVSISGGSINGTTIGGTSAAAGTFTTLNATGASNLGGLLVDTAANLTTNGSLSVTSSAATSTLFSNRFYLATSTAHTNGLFFADSSGNISASGTGDIFGNFTLNNYTGYLFANGNGIVTAAATIPNTSITGLGTMSTQNANSVAITGGTIDGATIGGTTAAAGNFTTLNSSGATKLGTAVTIDTVGNVRASASFSVTSTAQTSTLFSNGLYIATSTANPNGLFFVDASGNVSASGSITMYGSPFTLASNAGMQFVGSGNLTMGTGVVNLANGTDISPSLRFANSSGVGLSSPSTNVLDFDTATNLRGWFDANGVFHIGSSGDGNFFVDTSGDVSASGTITAYNNISFMAAGATKFRVVNGTANFFASNAMLSTSTQASTAIIDTGLSTQGGEIFMEDNGWMEWSNPNGQACAELDGYGFLTANCASATMGVSSSYTYNQINFARTTANKDGVLTVDSSGDITASGTLTMYGLAKVPNELDTGYLTVASAGNQTTTLFSNGFYFATSTAHNNGLLFVDSSGDVSASGSLRVWGHIGSSQASVPTVVVGGVGYVAGSVIAGGTDNRGMVTSTVAAVVQGFITVKFSTTFGVTSSCVISPTNLAARADQTLTYVTSSATQFTINMTGSPAGGGESWNYWCN